MISISKRVAAKGTVLVNFWEKEQGMGSKSLQNAACSKKGLGNISIKAKPWSGK